MSLKLYRDARGFARAEGSIEEKALSGFLESNVQAVPKYCREIIDHVDQVRSGKKVSWGRTGNAFTLILTPEKARIESDYADPPQSIELSLDDFEKVLLDWLSLIESPSKASQE